MTHEILKTRTQTSYMFIENNSTKLNIKQSCFYDRIDVEQFRNKYILVQINTVPSLHIYYLDDGSTFLSNYPKAPIETIATPYFTF